MTIKLRLKLFELILKHFHILDLSFVDFIDLFFQIRKFLSVEIDVLWALIIVVSVLYFGGVFIIFFIQEVSDLGNFSLKLVLSWLNIVYFLVDDVQFFSQIVSQLL